MKYVMISFVIALLAAPVLAHSRLASSQPADGAVLSAAPTELGLVFHDEVSLMKLTLTAQGEDARDLDLPVPGTRSRIFELPLGPLPAGAYQIEWRVIGGDGHLIKGAFGFSVE